jgi:hypothetical protein
VHGAERKAATGSGGPDAVELEHFAIGIDAVDSRAVGDQCLDLRTLVGIVIVFLGIEEGVFLEDGVQAAEGFVHLHARAELDVLQLGEGALQHEVVGRGPANAYP